MDPQTQAIIGFLLILGIAATMLFLSGQLTQPDCRIYGLSDCPGECVVCPPCEFCSSLRCQTESACESMGFGRGWMGK